MAIAPINAADVRHYGKGSVETVADCGLLKNSGLENGNTDWWFGGGAVITTDAFAGTKALSLPNNASTSQRVGVQITDTYKLTYFGKLGTPGQFAAVGIDFLNAAGTEIGEVVGTPLTTSGYVEYTIFTGSLPAGTTQLNIWIYSGAAAGAKFDEICLTKVNTTAASLTNWTDEASKYKIALSGVKLAGMSFYDFDYDNDLDLLVNTNDESFKSHLFRQNGSKVFDDVTTTLAPRLLNQVMERSAVFGDINNDGYLDFVRNRSTPNSDGASIEVYFQHPATGTFGNGLGGTKPVFMGWGAGVECPVYDGLNAEGLGLLDFDGDGDLDIIFDNHNYGVDVLRNDFINHSNRLRTGKANTALFTHATQRNGASVVLGLNQTATDGDYGAFVDINDDGWVDIFMRKRDENDFFLNQGGTFLNGVDLAQAENGSKGSNAIYDFDNDGDFDVFWTENDLNQFFRNDLGKWNPLGTQNSTGIPTSFTEKINEAAGGDVDNDGDIDLLLVGNRRSYLYINQINDPVLGIDVGQPMTFVLDKKADMGKNFEGFATLFVDIDDDGDLDVYMNASGPNQMYINDLYQSTTADYTKNVLQAQIWDNRPEYMAAGKRRPALGATVVLTDCQGRVLSGIREVSGGNGRGTQNPHNVHFGLPYGRNFNYVVVVKYPNYVLPDGTVKREVISKAFNPSQFGNAIPLLTFHTGEPSEGCPTVVELCANGIDDDGDGYIDCEDSDCNGMQIEHRIGR